MCKIIIYKVERLSKKSEDESDSNKEEETYDKL